MGEPQIRPRNFLFFSIIILAIISQAIRTSTGIMPESNGCEVFDIGIAAMSDTIKVTTSSLGCISLICLLPISRIARITNAYKSRVLIIEIIILSPLLMFAINVIIYKFRNN